MRVRRCTALRRKPSNRPAGDALLRRTKVFILGAALCCGARMLPCIGSPTGKHCRRLLEYYPHELAKRISKSRNIFGEEFRHRGRNAMEAILALGMLAVIWAVVIWGSTYFNRNVI
jgi:hypothetical protein